MRTKSSNVWQHFTEICSEKAKCKLCKKIYSRKGRTTSALLLHLKTKHNAEFLKLSTNKSDALNATKKSSNVGNDINKQLTLKQTVEKKQPWPSTHQKAIEIDRLIAEMIALHDLPFRFVEAIGFKRIIAAAWPCYHMRGREHFTKLVCEELYTKMAEKVKSLLNKFDRISFTTDIWSDPSAGVSLLSLTAHGISDDMDYINIILKCEPVEGSHTSDVILEKITLMLDEWGLMEKVHCIVHDRGSNIVRAMNLSSFNHVNCTVHQLQLCIKEGIFSNDKVIQTIDKAKRIVGHFNHSVLAQDRLKEIQCSILGKSYIGVVQDCPTRWNSTFYMMQRLLEIKDSIALYSIKYKELLIENEDWAVMESCVAILKPFEEITRQLSCKKTFLSSVIPLINALKKSLQDQQDNLPLSSIFNNVFERLKSEIEVKFAYIAHNKILKIATYLDPRFKCKFFTKNEIQSIQSEIALIKQSSQNALNDSDTSIKIVQTENISESPNSKKVQSILDDILHSDSEDDFDEITNNSSDLNKLKCILNSYENERKLICSEDPLIWWRQNKLRYKSLIPIVRQFLCAPAGSVASEQLFSGAGLIYDPLRNQLESNKAAKLLFLKYNMHIFNFEY